MQMLANLLSLSSKGSFLLFLSFCLSTSLCTLFPISILQHVLCDCALSGLSIVFCCSLRNAPTYRELESFVYHILLFTLPVLIIRVEICPDITLSSKNTLTFTLIMYSKCVRSNLF